MTRRCQLETNEIFLSFSSDGGNCVLSLLRSTLFATPAAGDRHVELELTHRIGRLVDSHGVFVRPLGRDLLRRLGDQSDSLQCRFEQVPTCLRQSLPLPVEASDAVQREPSPSGAAHRPAEGRGRAAAPGQTRQRQESANHAEFEQQKARVDEQFASVVDDVSARVGNKSISCSQSVIIAEWLFHWRACLSRLMDL